MSDEPQPAGDETVDRAQVPVTRTKEFWTLTGYAAVLGALMGLVAYVFLAAVGWGTDLLWPETSEYGWFSGEPWWILLMGAAGLTIGIIRRILRVEPMIPGLFDEIDERRVDPGAVPRRVLVAFVSLIGGASVGPEAPLASIGGGLGTGSPNDGSCQGGWPRPTRSSAWQEPSEGCSRRR